MDDTTKQPIPQTQQPSQQQSQPVVPQAVPQPQATVVTPPPQPVSGPHKEYAPIGGGVSDYIQPHAAEVEPILHPEVQEAGIETVENKEQPQINVDHQGVGIDYAPAATPITATPTAPVQLPYSYQEAKQIEKHTKIDDPKHWIAKMIEFLWEKFAAKGAEANARNS